MSMRFVAVWFMWSMWSMRNSIVAAFSISPSCCASPSRLLLLSSRATGPPRSTAATATATTTGWNQAKLTVRRHVESGSSSEEWHIMDDHSEMADQLRQYSRAIQNTKLDAALAMKPIRSLKRYLDNFITKSDVTTTRHTNNILKDCDGSTSRQQPQPQSQSQPQPQQPNAQLGPLFSNTLIQAFRTCGDVGDYRMIVSLLQSAFQLCQQQQSMMTLTQSQSLLALSPRVVGEALDGLGRTDASVSKLKQVYQWGTNEYSNTLLHPLGAFELNIMLKAVGIRKRKIQAALDVYDSSDIVGDAFTASTVLNLLTLSIADDQGVSHGWTAAGSNASPCWQYDRGIQVIRDTNNLNNFVFSAALKLNERASQVYFQPGRRHNGAKAALHLLGTMKQQNISPDIVTCTHVLSAFDKHQEWKAAVVMLTSMEKGPNMVDNQGNDTDVVGNSWHLPTPNEYAYSAAISACARCNQYEEAMRLLQQMKKRSKTHTSTTGTVQPNTWVYNAALSACVSPNKKNRNDRIQMALSLLDDMQSGSVENGNDTTSPDTVTYNTALAVMDGMGMVLRDEKGRRVCEYSAVSDSQQTTTTIATTATATATATATTLSPNSWVDPDSEHVILKMLQDMKDQNIPRDALTYHNAIQASSSNSRIIFDLLKQASQDLAQQHESHNHMTLKTTSSTGQHLYNDDNDQHHHQSGLGFVFKAALKAFAHRGDLDLVIRALNLMRSQDIPVTREFVVPLVIALGKSRNSKIIMTLLETVRGNDNASQTLEKLIGLDLSILRDGSLKDLEHLYAVSISSCLVAGDISSATSVLRWMTENGLSPSQFTMKGIAFAYTRLAIEAACQQSTSRRKLAKYDIIYDSDKDVGASGAFHADRAGAIVRELKDAASPQLLSAVASAYAATGSFEQARAILRRLHQAALDEQRNSKLLSRGEQEIINVLPHLHRSLLKICAGPGNVQAAYWFVEDIQNFANNLSSSSREICLADALLVPDFLDPADFRDVHLLRFNRTHTDAARMTGMRGEDWKLLLISASKAGDWKLCINTLQFLRPFLEAYHPSRATRSNADILSRKYRKLARGLTASVLCFEEQRHSAWALRAVDDWINWSGRRPPKEAILASIRLLASQGRGTEVTSLIQQVMLVKPSASDRREEAQHTYEEILYIGAITHLHNNGLYEDADELYLQAITNQHLPFSVATAGKDGHQHLDLHGMNVAIANSAVRIAFQQDVLQSEAVGDLVIVTGRGVNSFYQMRPILRPEIQRMLTEEFYPPLSTFSIPGNMGALRVPAGDIQEWAEHQRQQKGVKMLAVAGALKNLSSGLLRRSLNLSLNRQHDSQD